MYISEIQKRLMNIIGKKGSAIYNRAYGLALYRGANPDEMTDAYHLALWFEGAPERAKSELLSLAENCGFADYGLRICDICGKFMTEGYILGGDYDYACSRECAIRLYQLVSKGVEIISEETAAALLDRDLEENNEDYFWTEWYQE